MLLWDAVQTKEQGEECPNCQNSVAESWELDTNRNMFMFVFRVKNPVMLDCTIKYVDKDGLSVCLLSQF